MTGMPNASIVNAPPSVVITPKIDTPAIKSEDDISDKKQKNKFVAFSGISIESFTEKR